MAQNLKNQKHGGLKNGNIKGSMFLDFLFFISKLRFVFFNTEMEMKKSEIMEFGLKNDVKGDFLCFKNIAWHLLGIFMQPKFILRHTKTCFACFYDCFKCQFYNMWTEMVP